MDIDCHYSVWGVQSHAYASNVQDFMLLIMLITWNFAIDVKWEDFKCSNMIMFNYPVYSRYWLTHCVVCIPKKLLKWMFSVLNVPRCSTNIYGVSHSLDCSDVCLPWITHLPWLLVIPCLWCPQKWYNLPCTLNIYDGIVSTFSCHSHSSNTSLA